jgi:hypothetical protein
MRESSWQVRPQLGNIYRASALETKAAFVPAARYAALERRVFKWNHFAALSFCGRIVLTQNRFPLLGPML